MFYRKKQRQITIILGVIYFYVYQFELVMIWNKTSRPEGFKFMRFNCILQIHDNESIDCQLFAWLAILQSICHLQIFFNKIKVFKNIFHKYHQCQNTLDLDEVQHFL